MLKHLGRNGTLSFAFLGRQFNLAQTRRCYVLLSTSKLPTVKMSKNVDTKVYTDITNLLTYPGRTYPNLTYPNITYPNLTYPSLTYPNLSHYPCRCRQAGQMKSTFWQSAIWMSTLERSQCRATILNFSVTYIHRNLKRQNKYVGTGPANIFGGKYLVKNWLISSLDKVTYFKETFFQVPTYVTSLNFTK
jgi:hypothetical protein